LRERKLAELLADHKVNIVAFQSVLSEGKGLVRFVVDDPVKAKKTFDNEGLSYQETEIAEAKLSHRPGELARAASRLGEAGINIDYAYCGVDLSSNTPLLIFGVVEAGQAAAILDRTAVAA
jgi:hypothetical protein